MRAGNARPTSGNDISAGASVSMILDVYLRAMKSPPAKIDALLEPLLLEAGDERADELLSRLIDAHAEPVIKGVIRYKLHLNSHRASQREETDDLYQEVLLQLLTQLQQFRRHP